jgi:hypothetical protein
MTLVQGAESVTFNSPSRSQLRQFSGFRFCSRGNSDVDDKSVSVASDRTGAGASRGSFIGKMTVLYLQVG